MTQLRPDMFEEAAVRLDGVTLRYDSSEEILSGIDLVLKPGSFSFLTGASGVGKSSLLKLLYLAQPPTRGEVCLFGRPTSLLSRDQLSALRRRVGVVFQEFRLLGHLTAYENVALPLRVLGRKESQYRRDVEELLSWVGLGERLHKRPETLSGGEQQRVAIARAIAKRPDVLLCDEPTGALDIETGIVVLEVIERVNRELGTTTAVITHNAAIAGMADRVISVASGKISHVKINDHKQVPRELQW